MPKNTIGGRFDNTRNEGFKKGGNPFKRDPLPKDLRGGKRADKGGKKGWGR